MRSSIDFSMASLELVLQAATPTNHAQVITALLQQVKPTSVLIGVAFVSEEGVKAVEAALRPFATQTKFFVGIRNGVTTVQGVKRLLSMKATVYAVDTASREIFHPKIYLAVANQKAGVVIGSANLTFSGLYNNIEASALISLRLADQQDSKFIQDITLAFDKLCQQHPQHVFAITDEKQADDLFLSGRLADERLVISSPPGGSVRKGDRDALGRMKLHRVSKPPSKKVVRTAAEKTAASPPVSPVVIAAPSTTDYYLVWESNELSERDLNVPKGATTHRTGSMLLTKGAMDINPREYFRNEVFADLTWTPDSKKSHLERTKAAFSLVIKNVNCGLYDLRLTHNTKTDTKTFEEKNSVTQVHWGEAKGFIRRPDLLGKVLSLYRRDGDPPEFLIEID